jgi:hypothetical protein
MSVFVGWALRAHRNVRGMLAHGGHAVPTLPVSVASVGWALRAHRFGRGKLTLGGHAVPTLLALLLAFPAHADTASDVETTYLEAVKLLEQQRFEEAKVKFQRVLELEPQHAGAWLDLASTNCELGDATEAERLFREVEIKFAPSPGILDIIALHRNRGCKAWAPKSSRSITVTRAADSNINQGASNPIFVSGGLEYNLSDDYLPKRDRYTQLAFDYSRELNRQGAMALLQLRARRHDNESSQDTQAILAGAERIDHAGDWVMRSLFTASTVALGGQQYQRQAQLQTWIAPPIPVPEYTNVVLTAAVGHSEYVHRTKFDANTGELGALVSYRGPRHQSAISAGWLSDRGEAGRLGGKRHGWYASVQLQPRLFKEVTTELAWTRQDWRGENIYSANLIDAVRNQSTRQLRATLNWSVAPQHSVLLEWRNVRNKENISLFQYNSQSLQLSYRWSGL